MWNAEIRCPLLSSRKVVSSRSKKSHLRAFVKLVLKSCSAKNTHFQNCFYCRGSTHDMIKFPDLNLGTDDEIDEYLETIIKRASIHRCEHQKKQQVRNLEFEELEDRNVKFNSSESVLEGPSDSRIQSFKIWKEKRTKRADVGHRVVSQCQQGSQSLGFGLEMTEVRRRCVTPIESSATRLQEQEISELPALRRENRNLTSEKKNLEVTLVAVKSERDSCFEEIKLLKSDMKKKSEEIVALEWKIPNLEKENEILKKEIQSLKTSFENSNEEIKSERDSLKQLVHSFQDKYNKAVQDNYKLETELGGLMGFEMHHSKLVEEIKNLRAEKSELSLRLELLESEHTYCSTQKQLHELKQKSPITERSRDDCHKNENSLPVFSPEELAFSINGRNSARFTSESNFPIKAAPRRDSVGFLLNQNYTEDTENHFGACRSTGLTDDEIWSLEKQLSALAIEKKELEGAVIRVSGRNTGKFNAERERRQLENRLAETEGVMQGLRLRLREGKTRV
eukprot:GHVP01068904.1.p1 GENE.GHVP01068904.1~~GHVP01068904.1.p1  ORF type:complete len:508 (+),score=108.07 GHVP01068904.1:1610-3133(+)